jgi:hypothetical protein
MPAPLEHRAILKHRQVLAASHAARSRSISLSWLAVALFIGLYLAVWAGGLFAFWFVQRLPFDVMFALGPYLPALTIAVFAYAVVVLTSAVQNRVLHRAYLRNFTRLDIPLEVEALYEILPEGLRLTTDRVVLFPRWHAIDTLERVPQGWVISGDQLTYLLPRASFADEATERALVGAIVEKLNDPARERSPEAVAFVAAERPAPQGPSE